MRLLRAATWVTPDPDAAMRRYADWFGYRLVETGTISAALAQSWHAPALAGRGFNVAAPASGAAIFLRFVAGPAPAHFSPMRSFGWAAAELCVQDVQAVHERMKRSPFKIIGPPRQLNGTPKIWPMQVQGPDGEIIFLTEIRGDEPHERLPRATVPVDCLFIAVLACADIAVTRAWFETTLGLAGAPDIELAYTTLSKAFGLPVTQKHRIAVLTHDNDAFLQIDQYPAAATPRPQADGELPPGIAMVSFCAPQLPQGTQALHDGIIYRGGHSITLHAPDGGLVELIEAV